MNEANQELKWLFFDMDGTLIDTVPSLYSAYCDVCRSVGKSPTRQEFDPLIGASVQEIALSLAPSPEMALSIESKLAIARKKYLPERARLFPGVQEFLTYSQERGLHLWLVTSANREIAENLLGHTGIRDHFEGVVTADGLKANKPNPEIYLKALRLASANAEQLMVFEDSLQGISAALAANLSVVSCNTAGQIVDRFKNQKRLIAHFDDWHLLKDWFFHQRKIDANQHKVDAT